MKKVGIRFKSAGKVYDFDSGAFVLNRGDHVIVETEQGLGFGTVAVAPMIWEPDPSRPPLKKVYRVACEKDFRKREKNQQTVEKAYAYCLKCIKKLGLKMNLFAVESTFDGNKLTFFFTSDGRVDFRQLVKMLVKKMSTKIEMRQVGIRNQAKMCGGLGRCGRQICCSTFIEKFEPVSIRMAKEQSLSLNPTKISGQCGRLMCCLNYENDTYRALKRNFPKIGRKVETTRGRGKIIRHNVMGERFTVKLQEGGEIEITTKDLIQKEPNKPPAKKTGTKK